MLKNYNTCLQGLHHLTADEMYVLEWKLRNRKQNEAYTLHGQVPAERRLMRECFLGSVRHTDLPAKIICCSEWQQQQNLTSHNLDESLAKGHTSPWKAWRCLNKLRTGVACSKEKRKRWKYFNRDTTCECG